MDLYEDIDKKENLEKNLKNNVEDKFKEIKVKNRNYYPFLLTILLTLLLSVIFYFSSYKKIQLLFPDTNIDKKINSENTTLNNDTKDIEEKEKINYINTTDALVTDNIEEDNSDNLESDNGKEKEKESTNNSDEKSDIINEKEKEKEKEKEEEEEEKKYYYKDENEKLAELRKAKTYFDKCMKGELINNNNEQFIKKENPSISVVIPVYNSQNIIKPVIISIQNQNFLDLEIVLVNDFSTDNSVNIIKELQNEDPRIILLENTKNMGTLYSRCIGSLAAKGKYIFPLDNDDLFYDETVFSIIYKVAIKGNFDIVEFKGAEHTNYVINTNYIRDSEYCEHQHNLVLHQPKLGIYPRKRNNNYGVYDCFLWAKCINTEIYQKTINLLGKKSYSLKIIWGEDLVTSFALFRTAKSFKFIGKYGIFRYKNRATASNNTPYNLYILSFVLYLDVIMIFTRDDFEDKKYAIYIAFKYLNNYNAIQALNNQERQLLSSILQKILKNNYINKSDKERIKSNFNRYKNLGINLDIDYSNYKLLKYY